MSILYSGPRPIQDEVQRQVLVKIMRDLFSKMMVFEEHTLLGYLSGFYADRLYNYRTSPTGEDVSRYCIINDYHIVPVAFYSEHKNVNVFLHLFQLYDPSYMTNVGRELFTGSTPSIINYDRSYVTNLVKYVDELGDEYRRIIYHMKEYISLAQLAEKGERKQNYIRIFMNAVTRAEKIDRLQLPPSNNPRIRQIKYIIDIANKITKKIQVWETLGAIKAYKEPVEYPYPF